jgi:hypothetical protein
MPTLQKRIELGFRIHNPAIEYDDVIVLRLRGAGGESDGRSTDKLEGRYPAHERPGHKNAPDYRLFLQMLPFRGRANRGRPDRAAAIILYLVAG